MKFNDITDNEAIMLVAEKDEDAKNLLYEKYNYIIDLVLKKYESAIKILQIDRKEIHSEALYGFSDALNCYNPDKDASLPTFITLCIERKVIKIIKKFNTNQIKFDKESYSLDYTYDKFGIALVDMISDNQKNDPLVNLSNEENIKEIIDNINKSLSEFEQEVFKYMLQGLKYNDIAKILDKEPKQIDNTIQRVKNKAKIIINA